MNDLMIQKEGFAGRCQKVLQVANRLYQEKPDWVTFFRETLGVKGAARSVFPSQEDYVLFEKSNEFSEIQNLVASLRTRKVGSNKNEPTRVITVRLPESLHEALKAEASDHNTSMNKLCISKLLQVLIENEKAAQAAAATAAASRSVDSMMAPTPTPTPTPAPTPTPTPTPTQFTTIPQPSTPPQSPSFRSTYAAPAKESNGQSPFGQSQFGQ